MADDHPSGEVRPVIVRDVLDATESQGASVGMRFCAALCATGALPTASERRIISIRSRQMGIPVKEWYKCSQQSQTQLST
jgi:hypothetical protein